MPRVVAVNAAFTLEPEGQEPPCDTKQRVHGVKSVRVGLLPTAKRMVAGYGLLVFSGGGQTRHAHFRHVHLASACLGGVELNEKSVACGIKARLVSGVVEDAPKGPSGCRFIVIDAVCVKIVLLHIIKR